MVILCQGVHNHPAPPPDKTPSNIKNELQLVIKNSIEQNDTITAGSINSGICLNEHIYSILVIINNKIFSYIIFLIANLLKANFNAETLSDYILL